MPTATDTEATPRPTQRFLTTLRDVLFEATPEAGARAATRPEPPNSELEAARAVLRQNTIEQLGASLRELMIQVEGLREVLTNPSERQRAALRVLALKGISSQALLLELEQALVTLSAQNEAFSNKLAARRSALEQQGTQAIEACRQQTADAEQAIVRLQAELEAERAKIIDAAEEREKLLTGHELTRQQLSAKQLGFERAFAELHAEYATLKQDLLTQESR